MASIMLQYDLPIDTGKAQRYAVWVAREGLGTILSAPGATEVRAYRNVGGGSPHVVAILEFAQLAEAIAFMGSAAWESIVTSCRSFGIDTFQATLMADSPLVPEDARQPGAAETTATDR